MKMTPSEIRSIENVRKAVQSIQDDPAKMQFTFHWSVPGLLLQALDEANFRLAETETALTGRSSLSLINIREVIDAKVKAMDDARIAESLKASGKLKTTEG